MSDDDKPEGFKNVEEMDKELYEEDYTDDLSQEDLEESLFDAFDEFEDRTPEGVHLTKEVLSSLKPKPGPTPEELSHREVKVQRKPYKQPSLTKDDILELARQIHAEDFLKENGLIAVSRQSLDVGRILARKVRILKGTILSINEVSDPLGESSDCDMEDWYWYSVTRDSRSKYTPFYRVEMDIQAPKEYLGWTLRFSCRDTDGPVDALQQKASEATPTPVVIQIDAKRCKKGPKSKTLEAVDGFTSFEVL